MMNNTYILLSLISMMVAMGCNASKNHQKKDSCETTRSDTVSMNNDSLPPPPKPGPAPGQARIHGEITDIRESKNSQDVVIITLYLTGIDAYGPSTPPLVVQDSVIVKARKSTIGKEKNSSGKIVTAVISYQQAMLASSESPRWSLVTLD